MKRGLCSLGVSIVLWPALLLAEPRQDGSKQIGQVEEELERLKEENAHTRARMGALEQQLGALRQENAAKSAELEKQVQEIRPTGSSLGDSLEDYWGEHRFLITGDGFARYHWAERGKANNFDAGVAPIFLYRLSDRALFETEVGFELPEDAETETALEYAQVDYLLNDYMTLVAGKFLLPFGEYVERAHQKWIDPLVSRPLPLRGGGKGGIVPFDDIGAQVRGGIALAAEAGVDLDYSLYVTNGPRFVSTKRGAAFAHNNFDTNKGKAFGARIGLRPLPFSSQLGRWKIGASTYDGTWDDKDNRWVYIWGLDSVYQYGPWELRGEYINMLRELPGEIGQEHREGWYVQAAYRFLRFTTIPFLNRSELIFRYSQQTQLRPPEEEGEEAVRFLGGRQYAIGYDYWLSPTMVWKVQYDFNERRDQRNNNEIFTQIVYGF